MHRFVISLMAGVAGLALVSGTHAADLIMDEPTAGYVEAPAGDWDGPYVGVFGGFGAATYEDEGPVSDDEDASGWLIGLAAGANFTVADGVVAGFVADVAWADIGFDLADAPSAYSFDINWLASVRGKLGLDAGTFLPYLTAGLAVAGTSYEYASPGPNFDETAVHIGWTVGAGVEVAVSENASLDLLYRYSDYGSKTYAADIAPYDASFTTHTVSVGLNWKF